MTNKVTTNERGATHQTAWSSAVSESEITRPSARFTWSKFASQELTDVERDVVNRTRLLYKKAMPSQTLAERYPPVYEYPNKQLVYDLATTAPQRPLSQHWREDGSYTGEGWKALNGTVHISRWGCMLLPAEIAPRSKQHTHYIMREDSFTYEDVPAGELPADLQHVPLMEWHLNFASQLLFEHYSTDSLRQDDLQVCVPLIPLRLLTNTVSHMTEHTCRSGQARQYWPPAPTDPHEASDGCMSSR